MTSNRLCKGDPEYFRRSGPGMDATSRRPPKEDARRPRREDPEFFWRRRVR